MKILSPQGDWPCNPTNKNSEFKKKNFEKRKLLLLSVTTMNILQLFQDLSSVT